MLADMFQLLYQEAKAQDSLDKLLAALAAAGYGSLQQLGCGYASLGAVECRAQLQRSSSRFMPAAG